MTSCIRRPRGAQSSRGRVGPERRSRLTPVRFCTRQGEWRWLEWTTRVDFTRQRVYGAARDITERRRDEKALNESEARLRAIMKYSPWSSSSWDLEGRYLLVNDEFSRVSGICDGNRAVGMTASEVWPHDSATISQRERPAPRRRRVLRQRRVPPPRSTPEGLHGEAGSSSATRRHPVRHRRDRLGHHRAPGGGEGARRSGPPARLGDRGEPGHDHPDGPGREDPSDQRGRKRAVRSPTRGVHASRCIRLRPPRRLRRRRIAVHPAW